MSTIRRSTTGCWTCRARRKKCDESGPSCSICKSLGLICYGYGARPDWMDGGVHEKAKISVFKDIVKRAKLQKRRECSNYISPEMKAASPTQTESTVLNIDEIFGNTEYDVGMNLSGPLEWLDPVYDAQRYPINMSGTGLNPEHHHNDHDALQRFSTDTLDHFLTSPTCTDFQVEKLTDVQMETVPWNYTIEMSASQPDSQQGVPLNPPEALPSEHAHNFRADSPMPALPAAEVLHPELTWEEQQAWQYYIEVRLPSMFHFLPLEFAQRECRKALKACRNSVSCLRQIVSETEMFQVSELKRFGLRNSKGASSGHENHRPTVMLQRYDGFGQDCLLHVFISQINSGGNEWPGVVEWLSLNTSALEETCRESHFSKEILSYLEVLASTVTDRQPNLAIRHIASMNNSVALECATGVEPWLLDCLIRIIQLRKWKADQLSKVSLSMIELIKSSVVIENDLKRERVHTGKCSGDSARSAFMTVFKSATAVFLQCTVCGPRPEILEIQQGVSKTTDALRDLPHALLLKRLAWPVCVAASMAIETEQQEFFKTLHERIKASWGLEENICRALAAAIECWRLREGVPVGKTYDWTDGMKSLGCLWLLF